MDKTRSWLWFTRNDFSNLSAKSKAYAAIVDLVTLDVL